MRIGFIADIHSNLHALDACLKHAQDNKVSQLAFLGDFVGYGPQPAEVIDRVGELVTEGAWVVKGNHDEMAIQPPAVLANQGASSAAWTHSQLNLHQLAFLKQCPMFKQHEHILMTHASANKPERWDYVDSEIMAQKCLDAAQTEFKAQHVFVGHVHHQRLFYPGANRALMAFKPTPGGPLPVPAHRPMVVTVGSCGQPRDKDTRAMYAIYDTTRQKLCFQRVSYDVAAAAAAVRKAGLPEQLAKRLEDGV